MANEFFSSDHHFYHNNIIELEDRPFSTLEEMHNSLIEEWNDTVKEDDIVHYLGDLVFGGYNKWMEILPQLNGKINLYRGNHDSSKVVERLAREGHFNEFHMVGNYIKRDKYQLWLTHYPMDIGNRPNMYSISGHIHSLPSKMLNQVNVGIDSPLNFNRPFGKPVHLDKLVEYLEHINPIIEEKFKVERGIE